MNKDSSNKELVNNKKKLTVGEKRQIIKAKNDNTNLRIVDIAKEYGISYDVVRKTLGKAEYLLSIDVDDSILEKKNIILAPGQKTYQLECHMHEKYKKLREKSKTVDKLMLKEIAKNYVFNHDSLKINVTDYLIKKFIQKSKIKVSNFHGEFQGLRKENYESFFTNMNKYPQIINPVIFLI